MLYLDADMVFIDDIAKLYNTDLEGNFVGAVTEDVMVVEDVFGAYAEKMMGINRHRFFNAGLMIMDLEKFRDNKIEDKFVNLLSQFKFTVTQDEDLLNALCKDKVLYLDRGWNKAPFKQEDFDDDTLKVIHYKMDRKPWHYDNVMYGDYFWQYAISTPVYGLLKATKNNRTEQHRKKDINGLENLKRIAKIDSESINNYFNTLKRKCEKEGRYIDPMFELVNFKDCVVS